MKKVILTLFSQLFVFYSFAQENDTDKIKEEPVSIQFVGDANIQKSFTKGEGIPANTGIGVVFKRIFDNDKMKYWLTVKRMELSVYISIASTVDTINAKVENDNVLNKRDFGTFILFPVGSGQSASVNSINYFNKGKVLTSDGFMIRMSAANRVFAISPDSAANAGALSLRIGQFWEFVPEKYLKDYSITFSLASFFMRRLIGDISQSDYDQMRNRMIGTFNKQFYGWEPNVQIRLKNIKAEFGFPIIFDQHNVRALSDGQFATSIGFVGGFFLKL